MVMPKFAVPILVDDLRRFLLSEGVETPSKAVLTRFFEHSREYGGATFAMHMKLAEIAMQHIVSDGGKIYYVDGDSRILVDDDSEKRFEEISTICGLDPQRRLSVSP